MSVTREHNLHLGKAGHRRHVIPLKTEEYYVITTEEY